MEEGLSAVIVNPSVILGSGYWNSGSCALFKKIWDGLKYYPTGATGFIDVRDVARAIVDLMESNIHSERFILNAENKSFRDFFTKVAKHLDKKAPSIAVTPLLRALAWRGEWLRAKITGVRPIVTRETVRTSAHSFTYENQKITKALDFKFIPIEKTIVETCEQLKATLPLGQLYNTL